MSYSQQQMQDMITGRAPNPNNYNISHLLALQKGLPVSGEREVSNLQQHPTGYTWKEHYPDSGLGTSHYSTTPPSYYSPSPSPVPISELQNPQQYGGASAPNIPGQTPFQPTFAPPQMMSLDEMMDVISRRVHLATQPQIDAAMRKLEEQQLSGARRKGEVESAYGDRKKESERAGIRDQQAGSRLMSRRGIYDSGLATDLAHRIGESVRARGAKIGDEQARVLADLAEYLDLQQRHTNEEIQSIMGNRGMMAQSMLDEMHSGQQSRQDMLSQQQFENWLRGEAHNLNAWGTQMNEYWRGQEFDAGRADQDWAQQYQQRQAELQENQRSWERVFTMNSWQVTEALNTLRENNKISQQQFDNALALDDFNLRVKIYEWQSL